MSTIFDTKKFNTFVSTPTETSKDTEENKDETRVTERTIIPPNTPLERLKYYEQAKIEKPEFVYLSSEWKYYNTNSGALIKPADVRYALSINKWRTLSTQELIDRTNDGSIPRAVDVCYSPTPKEWYYNVFNPLTILQPSSTPRLHPWIKKLFENITHGDLAGIEWLHKCILYKYTHLDDVEVPCIVFYWKGGSGKSTFTVLLGGIFGTENLEWNISKQKLESQFDIIKGDKLIYELAEITTNNSQIDKGILNKLKTLIFAPKIRVNKKGQQDYETTNHAWFIINSNSQRPILLDNWDTENRRFTFFRSEMKLTGEDADLVYSILDPKNPNYDPNALADYLAWLYLKYPEVLAMRKIECLENEDKARVTQNSESKLDEFVRFLKQEYPFKKLWVWDVETAIHAYQLSYGNCDTHSLKWLFESYSPFIKRRWIVEGRGNVWYYDIK